MTHFIMAQEAHRRVRKEIIMTWEKPTFTEVRMDAEVSMYILVSE